MLIKDVRQYSFMVSRFILKFFPKYFIRHGNQSPWTLAHTGIQEEQNALVELNMSQQLIVHTGSAHSQLLHSTNLASTALYRCPPSPPPNNMDSGKILGKTYLRMLPEMNLYYYFCCCRQQTCCPKGVHNNKSSLYLFLNRNVCDLDRKLPCYWPGVTGSCMCCQPIYLRFLQFEQGHNNTFQISLNH